MLITVARTVLKTFDIQGRSSRRELLFYVVFIVGVFALKAYVEHHWMGMSFKAQSLLEAGFGLFIVPWIALVIRRVHDIGCSPWVMLAWFIPITGLVIHVWMLLDRGEPEENYYGKPPRY